MPSLSRAALDMFAGRTGTSQPAVPGGAASWASPVGGRPGKPPCGAQEATTGSDPFMLNDRSSGGSAMRIDASKFTLAAALHWRRDGLRGRRADSSQDGESGLRQVSLPGGGYSRSGVADTPVRPGRAGARQCR
jgi:hypothetical protein